MKVKNINGISNHSCSCGSWLKHWQRFSGAETPVQECAKEGCSRGADVGAHVRKDTNGEWFIIPLCQNHNNRAEELDIDSSTSFASANIQATCG